MTLQINQEFPSPQRKPLPEVGRKVTVIAPVVVVTGYVIEHIDAGPCPPMCPCGQTVPGKLFKVMGVGGDSHIFGDMADIVWEYV